MVETDDQKGEETPETASTFGTISAECSKMGANEATRTPQAKRESTILLPTQVHIMILTASFFRKIGGKGMPAKGQSYASCAGDCCSVISFVRGETSPIIREFLMEFSGTELMSLGYAEIYHPHRPCEAKTHDGCLIYDIRPRLCQSYYCHGKYWRPKDSNRKKILTLWSHCFCVKACCMGAKSNVHVNRDRGCPECGGHGFITDPNVGEVACIHCGLIIQEVMLDSQPEWRAFTVSEKRLRIRVGSPTSLIHYDKGLSTTFHPYTDAQGKALPIKKQLKMLRLRKWNTRARGDSDRNLNEAMNEMMRISEMLHLPPSIQENAAQIYRKSLGKKLVRGRSIKGMVAASVYTACRLTQTPRRLKDFVKASSCTRKEIARSYRLIQNALGLRMPVDNTLHYVARIASKVGIDQKIQNLAIELLLKAKARKEDVGKSPAGVAGAALYIASRMNGLNVTQSLLAEAAGVTEVTIRNRYKGLDKSLGLRFIKA